MPVTRSEFFDQNYEKFIAFYKALCQTPSPSGEEGEKALLCKGYLEENGVFGAFIDRHGNLIYECANENGKAVSSLPEGALTAIMAHTDTVFNLSEIPLSVEGDFLRAPSSGDNSANLALMLLSLICLHREGVLSGGSAGGKGLLLVGTTGEEGLGNLRGARGLFEDYRGRITRALAFDLCYDEICHEAVGSARWQLAVDTEGGHSYGDFGRENAIVSLAALIGELASLPDGAPPGSTFNVGTISGGTTINTIAAHAECTYEVRAADEEGLILLENTFNERIAAFSARHNGIKCTLLGRRPATGDVPKEAQRELLNFCAAAVTRFSGGKPKSERLSTDCNIPLSLGIPSVAVGLCMGGGAHTLSEWVDLKSLRTGFLIATEILAGL